MTVSRDKRLKTLLLVISVASIMAILLQTRSGLEKSIPNSVKYSEVENPRQFDLETTFSEAALLLDTKHYQHALELFTEIIKHAPHLPEAYVNRGYALIGLGQYQQAKINFNKAIDLNNQQLNAYFGLALSNEADGDLESAIGTMKVYVHLAEKDDTYAKRAWAAIWEWEEAKNNNKDRTP